jgi:hypothetical protein
VALLPWVLDLPPAVPGFCARAGIAFLGGFGHPPNVAAVAFFVAEIMPILRARLPGVPFRVHGSSLPARLRALAAEDVIFVGQVDDIATVFDACRIFVAPLPYGAGIKGKVLDCLAAGVPAVLSPTAAEAIPLIAGVHAMVAESPTQWVEAIVALYNDESRWTAMSGAARDLAAQAFGFARGRQMLSAALEQVDLYTEGNAPALVSRRARPVLPAVFAAPPETATPATSPAWGRKRRH